MSRLLRSQSAPGLRGGESRREGPAIFHKGLSLTMIAPPLQALSRAMGVVGAGGGHSFEPTSGSGEGGVKNGTASWGPAATGKPVKYSKLASYPVEDLLASISGLKGDFNSATLITGLSRYALSTPFAPPQGRSASLCLFPPWSGRISRCVPSDGVRRAVLGDARFAGLLDRIEARFAEPTSARMDSEVICSLCRLDHNPGRRFLTGLCRRLTSRLHAGAADPNTLANIISGLARFSHHPGEEFMAAFTEVSHWALPRGLGAKASIVETGNVA
jgi:hypothetical protein